MTQVYSVLIGCKDFLINPVTRRVEVYKTDEYGIIDRPTSAEKSEVKQALHKAAKKGYLTFSEQAEMGSKLKTTDTYGVWSI